jgi:hypothetical protein
MKIQVSQRRAAIAVVHHRAFQYRASPLQLIGSYDLPGEQPAVLDRYLFERCKPSSTINAAARGLDARLRASNTISCSGRRLTQNAQLNQKSYFDSDHGIYRDAWLSVVTVANDNDQSIQQARLASALGNPFGVCRILEWQPINMIFQ